MLAATTAAEDAPAEAGIDHQDEAGDDRYCCERNRNAHGTNAHALTIIVIAARGGSDVVCIIFP